MIYAAFRLRIQTVIFTAYTNIYIQRLFALVFFSPKCPEIWSPFSFFFFKCLFKLHNINKSLPKNYIYFIQHRKKKKCCTWEKINNKQQFNCLQVIYFQCFFVPILLYDDYFLPHAVFYSTITKTYTESHHILNFILLLKEGIISSRKEKEIS